MVEGDVIKVGRVKLKVREIKLENNVDESIYNNSKHLPSKMNEKTNYDNEKDNNINKLLNINKKDNDVGEEKRELNENQYKYKKKINLCRICYGDEKDIDSPLIQPCSCSGTMKYIHFACLQKWLKSKVVQKNTIAYSLKQIECELCKSLIPGKHNLLTNIAQISLNIKIKY